MNAKNILLGLCAVATLASCQKKDLEIPQGDNTKGSSPVFTSGAATKAGGNQWTPGDKVGIYMVKGGQTLAEENIVSGAKNISHLVSNLSEDRTSCKFNPENGSEKILFPSDGSTVDFVAYYPYKEGMGLDYTIDLSDQSNLEAIDFMIAKTPGKSSSDAVVPLTFSHGLSRLDIIATPAEGEDFTDATVTISGLPLKGALNLADGTITKDISSIKDITVPLNADSKVTLLLMPYTKEEALSGTITLKTKSGTEKIFKLRPDMMEPGRKYVQELSNKYFPDENFRRILSEWYGFHQENDDIDPYSETNKKAIAKMSSANLYQQGIKSLKGIEYLTELLKVVCEKNELTVLDVSQNIKMDELNCGDNKLTVLNVPESISSLVVWNNQLEELDLSMVKNLRGLQCHNNKLTSLIMPEAKWLSLLNCYNNQLTSLDVSKCPDLSYLHCYNNKLSSLDVSNNKSLIQIECYNNEIESLDLTYNTSLVALGCYNNRLDKLDISGMYLLTILVGAQKDNKILNLTFQEGSEFLWDRIKDKPENSNVTISSSKRKKFFDIAFREALVKDYGFVEGNGDINPENQTNKQLLSSITELNLSDKNIASLNGLEYFTSLTKLVCDNNNISGFDLTPHSNLVHFSCRSNRSSGIILPDNNKLKYIDCSHCGVSQLNLSQSKVLETLICEGNGIKILDVSQNTALKTLKCNNNYLAYLDITALSNLDFSSFGCGNQKMNSGLRTMTLTIADNQRDKWMSCKDKPENANVVLSTDITKHFPDDAFRFLLKRHYGLVETDGDIDPENPTNKALFSSVTEIEIPYLSDIVSCKGLEYFIALKKIYAKEAPQLIYLDFSKNIDLREITIWGTLIKSLDLTNNVKLNKLNCSANKQLTSLDVSKCTELNYLTCSGTKLTTLDVSKCEVLVELNCSGTKITSLDLLKCDVLSYLYCENIGLTSLDLSKSRCLEILRCSNNQLTSLDLSKTPQIFELSCDKNKLDQLDISSINLHWQYFSCGNQQDNRTLNLYMTTTQKPEWDKVSTESSNARVKAIIK